MGGVEKALALFYHVALSRDLLTPRGLPRDLVSREQGSHGSDQQNEVEDEEESVQHESNVDPLAHVHTPAGPELCLAVHSLLQCVVGLSQVPELQLQAAELSPGRLSIGPHLTVDCGGVVAVGEVGLVPVLGKLSGVRHKASGVALVTVRMRAAGGVAFLGALLLHRGRGAGGEKQNLRHPLPNELHSNRTIRIIVSQRFIVACRFR